jgi:hypothetical protein
VNCVAEHQCSEYPYFLRICMNNDIDDYPLWLVFAAGIWTLLTLLGIFSFGMMLLGYWWFRTAP